MENLTTKTPRKSELMLTPDPQKESIGDTWYRLTYCPQKTYTVMYSTPILTFMSYTSLSIEFHTFTAHLDSTVTPKNIQKHGNSEMERGSVARNACIEEKWNLGSNGVTIGDRSRISSMTVKSYYVSSAIWRWY